MSTKDRTRRLKIEQLELRRLLAINPTADEQEVLQYINRFRTDPAGEFNRVFSSVSPLTARNSTLQNDIDAFETNGSVLKSEWAALTPVLPLTWNEAVSNFSANHNATMIAQNNAFHSVSTARQEALLRAGVNLDVTAVQRTGEIIFRKIKSPMQNYASYAVNWGDGPAGMQDKRPHRTNVMNPLFDEIGGKITDTTADFLSPKVNSFVLANIKDAAVRVSGAVFEDKNSSTWYEAGEGRGGAALTFEHTDGRVFTTSSFSAGGYQVDLPTGSYKVRVSGAGMNNTIVRTLSVADKSLWVNFIYVPGLPNPDANEPNDAAGFATKLAAPNANVASMSLHNASDVDFYRYVPVGTGIATYELQFTHSSGNIDMQLLNAAGQVLASSATTGNGESIQFQADAGQVYFVRVFGAANSNYTLKVSGPEAILPDAQEVNDTLQSATSLPRVANPTLSALSLHSNRDVDHFNYVAPANGAATFSLQFLHAGGNVDLQLLNSAGTVLATSAGAVDNESINFTVQRDSTYVLKVYGGANKNYSVRVTDPVLQAPRALRDQATTTSDSRTATIAILSNDDDPDGARSDLTPSFVGTPPQGFSINTDKTIRYEAPAGFAGFVRATYTVVDKDGQRSSPANIDVQVVDYGRMWPWQNPGNAIDVSGDGVVAPSDALAVINHLNNSELSKLLPTSGGTNLFGFLDVTADGLVTATDAVLIINALNSRSSGEGEVSKPDLSKANDQALHQLMSGGYSFELEPKKRTRA